MRRVICVLAALLAVSAFAQESATYTPSENPFQAEYAFRVGQPLIVRVAVDDVRFESINLAPVGDATPAGAVNCTATVTGNNARSTKASVVIVMVLEDRDGKSLEKLTLEPFKVKPGRDFQVAQPTRVQSSTLAAATRVFLFIRVET